MKLLFLTDNKITDKQRSDLQRDYKKLLAKYTDIEPTYFKARMDFSNYPVVQKGKYLQPDYNYTYEVCKDIDRKYSGEGTDHVVFLIHKENWKSDPPGPNNGFWGINYSNKFFGYQVHYCRFDTKLANSLGTLHHEIHHSLDALIDTYLGVNVAPLVGVSDWDDGVTHGGSSRWDYIRYNENGESLSAISDLLKSTYAKRDAIYQQKVGKMKKQIKLLEQIIILIRQLKNNKASLK